MAAEVRLYAGSSGFSYKQWKGPFYPEKLPATKMLEFYFKDEDEGAAPALARQTMGLTESEFSSGLGGGTH